MSTQITRREFLKWAGALSLGVVTPKFTYKPATMDGPANNKNILIIVFDAWSASNISLYGYEHQTTPNLARLAEKAIVYHQHYAGGHFTLPGTASLLTGVLPWEHRAFGLYQQLDQ